MILITQIYLHALYLNEIYISLCFQRKDRHVERFGSQTRPNFQAAHNNCIMFTYLLNAKFYLVKYIKKNPQYLLLFVIIK